jgi:hypothetical protein
MKQKTKLICAGIIIGLCVAGYFLVGHLRTEKPRPKVEQPRVDAPPAPVPAPQLADAGVQANIAAPPPPQPRRGKPPLDDPLAREALAYVGADLDATLYWIQAINNPALSDHERKDLIEDLNEDGFANPKNVTVEELPLIVSRLAIIEELLPYAMDNANTEAFKEARKDLRNMYNRLTK